MIVNFPSQTVLTFLQCLWKSEIVYSQTCVQRPPLGPEKRGRYAEGYMKKISGQ
jgi:hypothetical protein